MGGATGSWVCELFRRNASRIRVSKNRSACGGKLASVTIEHDDLPAYAYLEAMESVFASDVEGMASLKFSAISARSPSSLPQIFGRTSLASKPSINPRF